MSAPTNGFRPLKPMHPYVKAQVFGEHSSGKSVLLARLAAGLAKRLGDGKPVAFLGTERAASDLLPVFESVGVNVQHWETRDPAALIEAMKLARGGSFSVVAVDSLTHYSEEWFELCKAQLGLTARGLSPSEKGDAKLAWRRLVADPLLNDPVHYLCTSRASTAYENEVDAETGKREGYQVGLHMRSGADAGYEANLIVRMERREALVAGELVQKRRAFVEKDRTWALDGKTFDNADYSDFAPAFEKILARSVAAPGSSPAVKLAAPQVFTGHGFARERDDATRKGLLLDEQEAWLQNAWPGSGKDAVANRTAALVMVYRSPAPGYAKTLRLQELEVRHRELHDALVALGKEAPSAFLDAPGLAAPTVVTGTSLAEALGDDLPSFPSAGVEDRPPHPVSPSSTPAGASLSVHQIAEGHAKLSEATGAAPPDYRASESPAASGGPSASSASRGGLAQRQPVASGLQSPVTVLPVTEPASALQAPKPVVGSVPVAGVTSEQTRSVNAGESGSVAGATGGASPPVAPARECDSAISGKHWQSPRGVCLACGSDGKGGGGPDDEPGVPINLQPKRVARREASLTDIARQEAAASLKTVAPSEMRDPKVNPVEGDVIQDGDWRIEVLDVEARDGDKRGSLVRFSKRLDHEAEHQADYFGVSLGSWRGRWLGPRDANGVSTAWPENGLAVPPGVPEATPPHGNPKARVPFTREIALESLGPKCSPSLISDLVECPEDQILGSGSQVLFQAERAHGKDVAENAWLSAGGKWSQATEKKPAPKRLSMKASQWRRFVMSLPAKFKGALSTPDAAEAVAEIASSHGTERAL